MFYLFYVDSDVLLYLMFHGTAAVARFTEDVTPQNKENFSLEENDEPTTSSILLTSQLVRRSIPCTFNRDGPALNRRWNILLFPSWSGQVCAHMLLLI